MCVSVWVILYILTSTVKIKYSTRWKLLIHTDKLIWCCTDTTKAQGTKDSHPIEAIGRGFHLMTNTKGQGLNCQVLCNRMEEQSKQTTVFIMQCNGYVH